MRAYAPPWALILSTSFLIALFLLLLASALYLTAVGGFLDHEQRFDARAADVIVPLGSIRPFRAMEAAALFHQGLAPHVLVPKPVSPSYMRQMRARGYAVKDPQDMAFDALVSHGVPAAAITLLPDAVVNTDVELESIGRYALAKGYHRVVLVTSWYHARRASLIWTIRFGSRPTAVIRLLSSELASKEGVERDSWWRSPLGWELVTHEYLGLTWLVLRHSLSRP